MCWKFAIPLPMHRRTIAMSPWDSTLLTVACEWVFEHFGSVMWEQSHAGHARVTHRHLFIIPHQTGQLEQHIPLGTLRLPLCVRHCLKLVVRSCFCQDAMAYCVDHFPSICYLGGKRSSLLLKTVFAFSLTWCIPTVLVVSVLPVFLDSVCINAQAVCSVHPVLKWSWEILKPIGTFQAGRWMLYSCNIARHAHRTPEPSLS